MSISLFLNDKNIIEILQKQIISNLNSRILM